VDIPLESPGYEEYEEVKLRVLNVIAKPAVQYSSATRGLRDAEYRNL
jgi:hypothetical protein